MKRVVKQKSGGMMIQKNLTVLAFAALVAPVASLAADSVTAPVAKLPTATSLTETEPSRGPRYKASFSYLTSRSASTDFRSFRSSATDDSGQVTEGSALPNMNYLSTRLSISPWRRHTFSIGDLQSLDSDAHRTIQSPGGGQGHVLPASIWSARYGFRINDYWNAGISETFVQGRKWSDPMAGLNFRSTRIDEQGLANRLGLNLSIPTTEHSHNDHLITRATARTSIAYVAGPWITSAGVAFSRPFYAHPGELAASNFDDPNAPPGSPQSFSGHHHGGGAIGGPSHTKPAPAPADPTQPTPTPPPVDPTKPVPPTQPGQGTHDAPGDSTNASILDASAYGPGDSADYITREREHDRTTSSLGVSYQPSKHWRFSSGAGVTYIETWGNHAVWLTNARAFAAAYDFGRMEIGSDVSLYSDIHKFAHPSLPSLLSVGFHLSYFLGADRQAQL
jgi:hypothetical protein